MVVEEVDESIARSDACARFVDDAVFARDVAEEGVSSAATPCEIPAVEWGCARRRSAMDRVVAGCAFERLIDGVFLREQEDGIDGIVVFDVRGEQDVVAVEGFAKHEEVLFAAFGGVFSDGGRERFPERVFDVFERVDSEAVAIGGVDPVREDVDHGLSDVGAFGGDVFEAAGEVA